MASLQFSASWITFSGEEVGIDANAMMESCAAPVKWLMVVVWVCDEKGGQM